MSESVLKLSSKYKRLNIVQSFDLIGDIHGQANELIELLEKLSYEEKNNIWQHENRKQNERSQIFLHKLKTQIDKNRITAQDYLEENERFLTMSKRLLKKADNRDATLSAKQLDTLIFVNALDFFINL